MSEDHVVEWKESWRDDYLRWICGFANSDGGTLVIGRNDHGEPVGVEHAERLLAEIEQSTAQRDPGRQVARVARQAFAADTDGVVRHAGAAVLLCELGEGDRRRVVLDPAPQLVDTGRRHGTPTGP